MGKNKLFNNKATTIHGILAIVFGIIVILYPALTVNVLATFFGLLLLVGGAILSIGAYMKKNLKNYGNQELILGLLSVVLAIVILSYPKETVAAFLLLSVGIWAVITGGILIWAYIHRFGDKKRRPITLVFGIASLFFGLFMALKPMEGTYGIAIAVGIYAILYGIHAIFYSAQKN
jgi:uncharacterized membrane protein HdeD (DUF308 family)